MNAVLFILLIVIGCVASFVWMQPEAAEMVALRLRARAAGVRAARKAYKSAYAETFQEAR